MGGKGAVVGGVFVVGVGLGGVGGHLGLLGLLWFSGVVWICLGVLGLWL